MDKKTTLAFSLVLTACLALVCVPAADAGTGDGGGDTCTGDVDGNGFVDVNDLIAVLMAWGTDDPAADVDGDGVVGVSDLVHVVVNFGPCDGTAQCESSADCDDGDPSTLDICIAGTCLNIPTDVLPGGGGR